ncbi:phosphate ABC transporter permease PstA [Arcanobacterium hippocoleae]|uniref:Phosphate transport system permease protein PstA n=1 Tax=Arcanobacterium hippocoleae TaxID=149017 RepID=A0ABU1T251_9ACTO|nr:phosphate ABC transporter permease PstA [Arcanobacterium hippocoleae]MDR6939341.1 phosphate transport system permease protein [Arcanobacterium hippocoleae]
MSLNTETGTQSAQPKVQIAAAQSFLAKQRQLPAWFNLAAVAVALVIGILFNVLIAAEADWIAAGIWSGVIFLVLAAIFGYTIEGRRYGADRVASSLIIGTFILAVIPLISLLYTVLLQGWHRMSDAGYLTATTAGTSIEGTVTGVGHAILGTFIVTGVTALISVPLGVLTAVYLVEYGKGPFAKTITFLVDIMTGIPSIVAGLFAAAMFPLILQLLTGSPEFKTGFSGSIALVVLMTPIVVRNTEEHLRLVPNGLRESAYALGVTKARTITKVVLRTSASGIISGVVIAIARVIGESAPLMITAGTTDIYNMNMFEGQMLTMPVYVYYQYKQGNMENAWGGALLLIIIVLLLNLAARWIAKKFAPKGEA